MRDFFSLHCEVAQFSAAQRLGERHTTKDIRAFIEDFHSSGAPPPREVICDESRALLNAVVLHYTTSSNIEEYADTLVEVKKIETRVRIDVAHFQKKYKVLLKTLPRRIYTYYMASIGQLIITQDLTEATKIIEALFLISHCETDGILSNGKKSKCKEYKEWLRSFITSKFP